MLFFPPVIGIEHVIDVVRLIRIIETLGDEGYTHDPRLFGSCRLSGRQLNWCGMNPQTFDFTA